MILLVGCYNPLIYGVSRDALVSLDWKAFFRGRNKLV